MSIHDRRCEHCGEWKNSALDICADPQRRCHDEDIEAMRAICAAQPDNQAAAHALAELERCSAEARRLEAERLELLSELERP